MEIRYFFVFDLYSIPFFSSLNLQFHIPNIKIAKHFRLLFYSLFLLNMNYFPSIRFSGFSSKCLFNTFLNQKLPNILSTHLSRLLLFELNMIYFPSIRYRWTFGLADSYLNSAIISSFYLRSS